jgi:hypothetical protein
MTLQTIEIGDRVRLTNTDNGDECVAVLKAGGTMGGAKHDRFLAFEGTISEVADAAELPELRTCEQDADEVGIAI